MHSPSILRGRPAGRQPSEGELRELLAGCAGYLAGVEPITEAALAAAPLLRVISRNGTGVDNIDLAAAAKRGDRTPRGPALVLLNVIERNPGAVIAALA